MRRGLRLSTSSFSGALFLLSLAVPAAASPGTGRTRATFPGELFEIGSNSNVMAAGDFNGDGSKDVVVINGGDRLPGGTLINPDLSVLFGHGDGTFAPQ